MSQFNLQDSFARAALRLQVDRPSRRSDAGKGRLPIVVSDHLRKLLLGNEKPRVTEVLADLERFCKQRKATRPSRAQIYRFMAQTRGHEYRPTELPTEVQVALYNLDLDVPVPGQQLAFYLFHHGSLPALSYAAGLPWLDLYQAARVPGWRPRTRGLLDAVLQSRRIS